MFRFFSEDESDELTKQNISPTEAKNLEPAKEVQWLSIANDYTFFHQSEVDILKIGEGKKNRLIKKFRKPLSLQDNYKGPLASLGSRSVLKDIVRTSDVESGVYEGGFKLWECAVDLMEFLISDLCFEFKGKKLLELGCGHGLPGLCALQGGAEVHLQDYNEEVISFLTIPNIALNLGWECPHARFFYGDWSSVDEIMGRDPEYQYDAILTSDTIYNTDYYPKLVQIIRNHLKPNGVAFVAAKSYYFGVGGGVELFLDFLKQQPPHNLEGSEFALSGTKSKHFEDGTSNIREILELRWTKVTSPGETHTI